MATWRIRDKWRYEFERNGVRHGESGFLTKKDAKAAEAEARKNLVTINTDFVRLAESRLDDLKARRTDKYYRENVSLINNLLLRWEGKKTITREDVEEYLMSLPSPFVANKHLRFLKALWNHGVEREWFTYNPAGKIKHFPIRKKQKYIPPLGDIKLVLELCNPEQRRYLLVVAHTMGRIGSVNQLKWEDIHEDYLSLYTRKARNSDTKEIKVPLNDVLKQVLSEIPRAGLYLFINPRTQRPYDYRDKFLPNLCRDAGVKPFMYHALRHYGASLLAHLGTPLTDIQKLLGHEKATTTDIYLQSLIGSTTEAVKKLEGLR
jgi:integrase